MAEENKVGGADALDVRSDALGPLFTDWEEPRLHRARAEVSDMVTALEGLKNSRAFFA